MAPMIKIEPTRHQVAVAGQVTDKETGKVVSGAQIEITSAPPAFNDWLAIKKIQYGARWDSMRKRPDRTRTAPDGYYYLMDLPDGPYKLTASRPESGSRFGNAQVDITVARDAGGNITLVTAPLAIPATTLKGKILHQVSASVTNPVVMADIRVKGSGERALSDGQGQYCLAGLEKGQRTLLVSARGLVPASQTVQLDQGAVATLDVVLLAPTG